MSSPSSTEPVSKKKEKKPKAKAAQPISLTAKKGVIKLKMPEASEAAYREALLGILDTLDSGFTPGYRLKFKPPSKTHGLPGMPKTQAAQFWNACARYPQLWPLMRQYITRVEGSGKFYTFGSNEDKVPAGGYATYALGLASLDNQDIVEEFMAHNKITEDNCTPSIFTACFIDKFGINEQTARTVIACVAGSSDTEIAACYPEKMRARLNDPDVLTIFDGLDDVETVTALAGAMKALKLKGSAVNQVVRYLYGDWASFERLIEISDAPLKDALRKIENRAADE